MLKNSFLSVIVCHAILFSFSFPHAADLSDYDKNNQIGMKKLGEFQDNLSASRTLEGSENSLDPNRYYIGGGDQFFISLISNPAVHYFSEINQQGDLYIPELGLKKLGKITLNEAQKQISSFIQIKLKKPNDIYVVLIRAKKVIVTVNGAVANAGTYTLPGSYRIIDAIRVANNNFLPSLNECNYREVQCSNKDSVAIFDLFEYLLKNDVSSNPYLYPGDNITLTLADKRIYLNAATKSVVNGWIPIKNNETLSGLLSFFNFDALADTSIIYLQKYTTGDSHSIQTIFKKDAEACTLYDRSVITIPPKKNYDQTWLVEISGEVCRPGGYPIIKDSTTVDDIIAMAGGYSQYANIDRAVIVRRSKILEKTDKKTQESLVSEHTLEATVRPELYAGLKKMASLGDFSIIDLKKHAMSTVLVSEDHIIIPRKEIFVYVSGDVKRPGAYKFCAGQSFRYYINAAGGYTERADKSNAFGIRYFGNASQMTDLSEICEGDIIVVPDSEQRKFLSTVILPIFQAIVTTLSLGLAVFSLTNK